MTSMALAMMSALRVSGFCRLRGVVKLLTSAYLAVGSVIARFPGKATARRRGENGMSNFLRRFLSFSAVALLAATHGPASAGPSDDRLEPGLQGQSMPQDNPGSVLARPFTKGVRVVGHDPIRGRDNNIQMAWVDHCAYVSSAGGKAAVEVLPLNNDPALTGIAVIDVSDPSHPITVKLLRDRASIFASETMHALTAPDGRKVLAAGTYGSGKYGPDPSQPALLAIYDVSDCANPKLTAEIELPENVHTLTISPDGRRV